MVPNAASWVWSSYRSIVDATSPPWLETDWILGQFANERTQAQQEYVAFVDKGGYQRVRVERLASSNFPG